MLTNLKILLPKGEFARGVSILVGGTASAQLLLVLASPLLTRLYTPQDFGLLAAFTALLGLITVIASGRYELAIPLPEQGQDAINLVILGLICVFFTTLISFVGVIFFSDQVALALNSPELAEYLWLVPIGVLFVGGYQVFNKWAIRSKNFGGIARTRIWQTVGTLAIQVGGSQFGLIALVSGQTGGQGLGATSLGLRALKHPKFKSWSWGGVMQQACYYRNFPLYSTWTGLFNTASLHLAPIIFISLFGASTAGFYALTLRMLSMPSSLIGEAIGNVFLSSAPDAQRRGELRELVKCLHKRLAMTGAVPLAILLLFGPNLFALIFGEEWRKAGQYAQWMAPWIYLQFQWSPLSMLASIMGMQKAAFISQFFTLAARLLVLLLCYMLAVTADITIAVFSIVSAIGYFLVMAWFVRKAGVDVISMVGTDLKYIALFLMLLSPFYLVMGR